MELIIINTIINAIETSLFVLFMWGYFVGI